MGGSGTRADVCLWQSGCLATVRYCPSSAVGRWKDKSRNGCWVGRAKPVPVFAWAAPTLVLNFHFSGWRCDGEHGLWVVFLSFTVAFRHANRASESVLWSVNTVSRRWGARWRGSSLAVPASPQCLLSLKPRVCVCVYVFPNLVPEKKKINVMENLLFLHVSFLHLGFEFKFHLILHSLCWNHSC